MPKCDPFHSISKVMPAGMQELFDCDAEAEFIDQEGVPLCKQHHATKGLAYHLMGRIYLDGRPINTPPNVVQIPCGELEFILIVTMTNFIAASRLQDEDLTNRIGDELGRCIRAIETCSDNRVNDFQLNLARLGQAAFPYLGIKGLVDARSILHPEPD